MITLTSAPRSLITHGISALRTPGHPSHSTICGREISEDWTGEMSAETPPGIPTCKVCRRNVDAGYPRTTPVISRQYVNVGDTFRVLANGVEIGTVDPVRDQTGDYLARRAGFAEIVAPRFSDATQAEAYVLAGENAVRPQSCHSDGSCIRQGGHFGLHRDAHRYSWDESIRWDHGSIRKFAPWEAVGVPAGVSAGFSRWVKVNGMWTHPDRAAERSAAMERHPAGKGRTLRDHRADSDRAADGSERLPESIVTVLTRKGWTPRRATRTGAQWVVMAYRPRGLKDNGTYEYVVATIREGDQEWNAGRYSSSPLSADENFRARV